MEFQEWVSQFLKEKGITKEQLLEGVTLSVPCTDGKEHEFTFYLVKADGGFNTI